MSAPGDAFLSRRLPSRAPGVAVLLGRLPSRAPGDAFLPRGLPSRASGVAVLLGRFAFGARSALRFCWGVLRSVHACCLPHGDKQDGLRYASFLFCRVEIAIRAFSMRRCGYLPLWVHFKLSRLFLAITTGCRGRGERGWRRGRCTLLRGRIGFAAFSAGSTLGLNVEAALRPPQTAPKSRMWKRHCRLSGLSSRCGGVGIVRYSGVILLQQARRTRRFPRRRSAGPASRTPCRSGRCRRSSRCPRRS